MILETARTILRYPEPEDAKRIYEYRNDPEVVRHLSGFSLGMAMNRVHEWIESHQSLNDDLVCIIADRENSTCLGHVGLYKIDHRLRLAEYGICIGFQEWWQKGLGREVTTEMIRYGFNELQLEQIRLEVLETNLRATALYEGLGFKHDGRLRRNQFRCGSYIDSLIMSLLKSEWGNRAR